MKPISFLPSLLACGLVLLVVPPALAQRAGGGRAGGGGGGGGRTGAGGTPGLAVQSIDLYAASSSRGGAFNDLELTELTRLDEQVEAEIRAVRDARDALQDATWELPGDPAALQARANTLAEAELRLALARATAFATFRQSHTLTEAQRETLVNQVASGTLNGGGIAGIGVGGARPPTPPGPAGTE